MFVDYLSSMTHLQDNPPSRLSNTRRDRDLFSSLQNISLIGLNTKIDLTNKLEEVRQIIYDVHLFDELNQCVDYLGTNIDTKQVFLITSNVFGQQLVPHIHALPYLKAIYLFGENEDSHQYEIWSRQWSKIKGIYAEIEPICKALKLVVEQYNRDTIPLSFIQQSSKSLDPHRLEPSFMYSRLFKTIILSTEYDEKARQDLTKHLRQIYAGNTCQLAKIDTFEKDYNQNDAIRWYTQESFMYQIVNQSLRLLEGDLIVNMSFFIHNLHQQIEQFYKNQRDKYEGNSFVVYRGQGISKSDFQKLQQSLGGLISFNSFLSTSKNKSVSQMFADSSNPDMVSILFIMTIDPNIDIHPFATLDTLSSFPDEEEILFSTHTIFRINSIQPLMMPHGMIEVQLKLTADDDDRLKKLTTKLNHEIGNGPAWHRMGQLLLMLEQPKKAEELYLSFVESLSEPMKQAICYDQLAVIKDQQAHYTEAILYHEKSLSIKQISLSDDHPDLASTYNNIAMVHTHMGQYSIALSYCEKSLDIREKILPSDHPHLALSYNNIAFIYTHLKEYSKALFYYQKSLEIRKKSLLNNHFDLATSYNNIAEVYSQQGNFSEALISYQKSRDIMENALPSNHPHLGTCYNNIGNLYNRMGNYDEALVYYQKSQIIFEKSLPSDHPSLSTLYNNLAFMYDRMGDYAKALSLYEKSLALWQKTLPHNHPHLVRSYNNIGKVYDNMQKYSESIDFYQKALDIRKETLSDYHPDLVVSYQQIAGIYRKMKEYSKALINYEKLIHIQEIILSNDDPSLATSYNNMAGIFDQMGEYSTALLFFEKSLSIRQQILHADHCDIAQSYNNIAGIYYSLKEYSKAQVFFEKSLEIYLKNRPKYHPDLAGFYTNMAMCLEKMTNYSDALLYFEKALDIQKRNFSHEHPSIILSIVNILRIKKLVENSTE